MLLHELLKEWPRDPSFTRLIDGSSGSAGSGVAVTGIDGSARAFLLAGLAEARSRPMLVIAPDAVRAEKIYEGLLAFLPAGRVGLLPARDLFITADLLTVAGAKRQRLF